MNNAEKFKQIFGLYATELWSMPEGDFLAWLNRDVETTQIDHTADIGKKVCVDTISRQAALDAIIGQPPEPHYPSWYAAQIEKLPAAQPATNCSEIPNGSDDTISRQAALDALKGLPTWWADEGGYYGGAQPPMVALLDPEDAVSAIENMPSVQPEQNGKWIYNSPTTMKCDRCGFAIKDWDWHRFKYCPNCGADMRGEKDG